MKYIDEFRKRDSVMKLAELIRQNAVRDYTFMEVCGGHTAAIHRFGLPSILPGTIKLISGPGCPVCVTGTDFIDKAVEYSTNRHVIIATFGDMIRVPGSSSSLEKEKAKGADVRIVLSATEALEIAKANPRKLVIFLAVGFETTGPGTAVSIMQAEKYGTGNFCILCAHKVMPPAMELLIKGETNINGFICPGHVAAITGSRIFDFIPERFEIGCVVSGFEPADILLSILMLVKQVNSRSPQVEIQYTRVVSKEGNRLAMKYMNEVFDPCDALWRGLGKISAGGLRLKKDYQNHDAEVIMPVMIQPEREIPGCICGEILKGLKTPAQCPLYLVKCVPENPVGACMVSSEGSCNTWYRYKNAV
jgi:hydrogenase expression/formation protein HypD